MRHTWLGSSVIAVVVFSGSCTRLTPEQQLIHDAAAALGGVDRITSMSVLQLAGSGVQYNLGQDVRPGLADQTFDVSAYERMTDLRAPRLRVTQTRTPRFAYFQGPQAQTQVQGVDGEIAYNVGVNGAATRASSATAADRRLDRYHHPVVFVAAALADGATLSPVTTNGGERVIELTTPDGPVTLVVGADNRPLRVESLASHANLGDVAMSTTFESYEGSNGLQLPARLTTKVDDFTTGTYRVSYPSPGDGSLAAPEAAANAQAAPAAPPVNVAVEELARGVWRLAGQSHHSVVVGFKDRLVMIEAPQSEARSLAAIAKARELQPGTPLTHMVMTHHHFDHSTGLRAAIAEGLTIVTQQGNEAFVREIAARPFTRQPDALARAGKPMTVEAVGDSRTITDGSRSLVLYHLAGNPHSETMLMAYLPAERLVVEVDVFTPGGSYHPYAANLLEHIERAKLRVDRIISLHGNVAPFAELVKAVR